MKIENIKALEILDSRGNPTISVSLSLEGGACGKAAVPSGASTGRYEALELRDGDKERYQGKGVLKAIANVVEKILPAVKGKDFSGQEELDNFLIELDGSEDKSNLGANAILGVSLAFARAAAKHSNQPLYKYLSALNPEFNGKYVLPMPMMNVLNGGKHANWASDIQEYLILPVGAPNFKEAIRYGAEVYHALKKTLQESSYSTGVGDEGGFAPSWKNNEEPFQFLEKAVEKAAYKVGSDFLFGIDAAASEFYQDGSYDLKKEGEKLNSAQLIDFYKKLSASYPAIVSFEDTLAEDDWQGFKDFTAAFAPDYQIVGDDLYVTNVKRLQRGIEEKSSNSILIKLNQIGTITETVAAINLARKNGMTCVVSHRSGETEDSFIADFTVAMGTGQIKTGAPGRSERTAKYNRLLEIASELGDQAEFASLPFSGR